VEQKDKPDSGVIEFSSLSLLKLYSGIMLYF